MSLLLCHLIGFHSPCVIYIIYFMGNLYWPVKVNHSDTENCWPLICGVLHFIASFHTFSWPSADLFLKWEPMDRNQSNSLQSFSCIEPMSTWDFKWPQIKTWHMLSDTACNCLWDPEINTKFDFLYLFF